MVFDSTVRYSGLEIVADVIRSSPVPGRRSMSVWLSAARSRLVW